MQLQGEVLGEAPTLKRTVIGYTALARKSWLVWSRQTQEWLGEKGASGRQLPCKRSWELVSRCKVDQLSSLVKASRQLACGVNLAPHPATPDSLWKTREIFPTSAPHFRGSPVVIHAFFSLFSQGLPRYFPVCLLETSHTHSLGNPGHQRSLPTLSFFHFSAFTRRINRHGNEGGEVK